MLFQQWQLLGSPPGKSPVLWYRTLLSPNLTVNSFHAKTLFWWITHSKACFPLPSSLIPVCAFFPSRYSCRHRKISVNVNCIGVWCASLCREGGATGSNFIQQQLSSTSLAPCLQGELLDSPSGVPLIFKCLFSKSIPQVPTKKLKKYEREYQTMRESQLQQEDPMDRYKVREMLFGKLLAGLNPVRSHLVPVVRQRCVSHAHLSGIFWCRT